jgi:translation initiation factor IF-1
MNVKEISLSLRFEKSCNKEESIITEITEQLKKRIAGSPILSGDDKTIKPYDVDLSKYYIVFKVNINTNKINDLIIGIQNSNDYDKFELYELLSEKCMNDDNIQTRNNNIIEIFKRC